MQLTTTAFVLALPISNAPPRTKYPKNAGMLEMIKANAYDFVRAKKTL
jgi:hypothetical protein